MQKMLSGGFAGSTSALRQPAVNTGDQPQLFGREQMTMEDSNVLLKHERNRADPASWRHITLHVGADPYAKGNNLQGEIGVPAEHWHSQTTLKCEAMAASEHSLIEGPGCRR